MPEIENYGITLWCSWSFLFLNNTEYLEKLYQDFCMKCFYSPNFSTGLLAYRGWLNQILAVSDRNLLFWLLSH